jgi:chromosome segregation ATPase
MGKLSSYELREQLADVQERVRQAIRAGDEEALIKLRARQDVLPVQILNAEIREAEGELAEIDRDLQTAQKDRESNNVAYHSAIETRKRAEEELRKAEAAVNTAHSAWQSSGYKIEQADKRRREKAAEIEGLKAQIETVVNGGTLKEAKEAQAAEVASRNQRPAPAVMTVTEHRMTRSDMQRTIEDLKDRLTPAEADLARIKAAHDSAVHDTAVKENEIRNAQDRGEEIGRLSEELLEQKRQASGLARELQDKQTAVERLRNAISTHETNLESGLHA